MQIFQIRKIEDFLRKVAICGTLPPEVRCVKMKDDWKPVLLHSNEENRER